MICNPTKLSKELTAAGITSTGCSAEGIVWGPDGTTEIQTDPAVAAIILAHDPTEVPIPSMEDQITALQAQVDNQNQLIQDLLTNG